MPDFAVCRHFCSYFDSLHLAWRKINFLMPYAWLIEKLMECKFLRTMTPFHSFDVCVCSIFSLSLSLFILLALENIREVRCKFNVVNVHSSILSNFIHECYTQDKCTIIIIILCDADAIQCINCVASILTLNEIIYVPTIIFANDVLIHCFQWIVSSRKHKEVGLNDVETNLERKKRYYFEKSIAKCKSNQHFQIHRNLVFARSEVTCMFLFMCVLPAIQIHFENGSLLNGKKGNHLSAMKAAWGAVQNFVSTFQI